jgi:ribonuclease D
VRSELVMHLDTASISLGAGRDLLQTDLARNPHGERQLRSEWRLVVTSPAAARAVLAEMRSWPSSVAWDIETSGLDPRTDRIGTAQLYAPGLGTVVVQLGADVPQRLCRLLADPAVCKVFHHAMFDHRFMVAHWDAQPARIACTKIASKLLRPQLANNGHSLQSLLASYLGVEISKDLRLTDWLAPELTAAQLAYASRDVVYLIPLLSELAYPTSCNHAQGHRIR